jgi:hypothetical protein
MKSQFLDKWHENQKATKSCIKAEKLKGIALSHSSNNRQWA